MAAKYWTFYSERNTVMLGIGSVRETNSPMVADYHRNINHFKVRIFSVEEETSKKAVDFKVEGGIKGYTRTDPLGTHIMLKGESFFQ